MADAKTSKNRAKRQKKRERAKKGPGEVESGPQTASGIKSDKAEVPIKKRRLVNGKELVFRRPGEDSDDEDDGNGRVPPQRMLDSKQDEKEEEEPTPLPAVLDTPRIMIHEDD